MDIIDQFISNIHWESIISSAVKITLVLLLAWVLVLFIRIFLSRLESRLLDTSEQNGEPPSESEKRIETIIRLVRQAALIALWVTVSLVVLKEVGVEIAPLIASAGILGLAVGFGAQNLVRDVISGFFIILENQIRVGDVAVINGTGGLVEKIQFRTTVLRDLAGVVHIFPNGTITTLSNLTQEWSAYVFEIGVAYKEDADRVMTVMDSVGEQMKADEHYSDLMLEKPEIFGVDKLADSAVVIKGRIKTLPIRQWEVGREYLRRIKQAFDEQGIEIPFPHRTLYFGDASKPFDIQLLEKYAADRAASN